jgi:hypothetical protein
MVNEMLSAAFPRKLPHRSDTYIRRRRDAVLSSMAQSSLHTLRRLRATFEAEQDWVAVGHIEYLIDRLVGENSVVRARTNFCEASNSLH